MVTPTPLTQIFLGNVFHWGDCQTRSTDRLSLCWRKCEPIRLSTDFCSTRPLSCPADELDHWTQLVFTHSSGWRTESEFLYSDKILSMACWEWQHTTSLDWSFFFCFPFGGGEGSGVCGAKWKLREVNEWIVWSASVSLAWLHKSFLRRRSWEAAVRRCFLTCLFYIIFFPLQVHK